MIGVLPTMTPTEAAYLAGIIDGEGSISMTRVGRASATGPAVPYWRLVLAVNSCDRALIEWLIKWGGSTLWDMDRGPNHRPQHRWTVVGNAMRSVLPQAVPYLIIKKDRAKWAIEALAIMGDRKPFAAYTDDQKAQLIQIRRRFEEDPSRSMSVRNRETLAA